MSASGSLAKTLTWRRWHGRNILERIPLPTGAATAPQTAHRLMFGFLVAEWASLSVPAKASWAEPAAITNVSPFNAYVSLNLRRWKLWHAPGQTWPVAETGTPAVSSYAETHGQSRSARHYLGFDPANDGWAVSVYEGTPVAFTTTRNHCIAIVAFNANPNISRVQHHMTAGDHFFNLRAFTTDGKFSAVQGPWGCWPFVTA